MSAANSIDAKSKKLMELLYKKKYQVKYFQREYRWQKGNIEDLLVDLERSFMSNFSIEHTRDNVPDYDCYYMGPVVLYREKTTFVIVDGQQRLTSFTLLLIYLNHLQKEILHSNEKKIQVLDEYIYSQPFEYETFNMEIPEREPILKSLFKGTEIDEGFLSNESSQNIYNRFLDIIDLFPITLKHESVLPLFINWLVEKLIFIEIMAQTSDSAYTIFESMNDRGLKLTQTELLKSYLLSNVKDDLKIKELDLAWKKKIATLKSYSHDEEDLFFKAWLRAKYAVTIRQPEKGATNQDFERIGTRFSNWVQDSSKRLLNLDNPENFYYFVYSDFHFFSELYIKISDMEISDDVPEHILNLISYKGISSSLTYPFIMSTITKLDDEQTIYSKINLCASYLDSYAVYRLLLNQAITQSSVDYHLNRTTRDIRDRSLDNLNSKFTDEIKDLKEQFLRQVDYIKYDHSNSKFILTRLFKSENLNIPFRNIYFQRKRESFTVYHFLRIDDYDSEVNKIPKSLKEIFLASLCAYVIIPGNIVSELNNMTFVKRLEFLLQNGYFFDLKTEDQIDYNNLKEFFIKRNRRLKDLILQNWKV